MRAVDLTADDEDDKRAWTTFMSKNPPLAQPEGGGELDEGGGDEEDGEDEEDGGDVDVVQWERQMDMEAEKLRTACMGDDENLGLFLAALLGAQPGLINWPGDCLPTFHEIQHYIINAADAAGQTPLMLVVQNRRHGVLKCLVEDLGANVNAQDLAGRTPLFFAAINDDGAMGRFLLDHGASPGLMAKLTWDLKKKTRDKGCTPLMAACVKNHHAFAGATLMCSSSMQETINMRGEWDNTALHWAAKGLSLECIKMLIDCNADINAEAVGSANQTPLICCVHGALSDRREECMRELLDSGAKTRTSTDDEDGFFSLYDMVNEEVAEVEIDVENLRTKMEKLRKRIPVGNKILEMLEEYDQQQHGQGGKGSSQEGHALKKADGGSAPKEAEEGSAPKEGPARKKAKVYAACWRKEPTENPKRK